MRPAVFSQTGTGSTNPWVPDRGRVPTNIAVGVKVTGTVNYTVQYTYDDPFAVGFTPSGAVWYNHSTLVTLAANADGNFAFYPRAVRLTVNSGTGTATMTFIQSGT